MSGVVGELVPTDRSCSRCFIDAQSVLHRCFVRASSSAINPQSSVLRPQSSGRCKLCKLCELCELCKLCKLCTSSAPDCPARTYALESARSPAEAALFLVWSISGVNGGTEEEAVGVAVAVGVGGGMRVGKRVSGLTSSEAGQPCSDATPQSNIQPPCPPPPPPVHLHPSAVTPWKSSQSVRQSR